jgi:hypothetical protein
MQGYKPESIGLMNVSPTCRKALARAGCSTVADVCRMSAEELLVGKWFGCGHLAQVRASLAARGLRLNKPRMSRGFPKPCALPCQAANNVSAFLANHQLRQAPSGNRP